MRDHACRARILASCDDHEKTTLSTLLLSVDSSQLATGSVSPPPAVRAREVVDLAGWEDNLLNTAIVALQGADTAAMEFAQGVPPMPPRKAGIKAFCEDAKQTPKKEGIKADAKSTPEKRQKPRAASRRAQCKSKPHSVFGSMKLHLCSQKSYITGP